MALPRIRNIVLYTAVTLSIVFMKLDYYFARLVNPVFLANLFTAWELSRTGIHNKAQINDLRYIVSVIRAYIIYPTKSNLFLLFLICVSLAYLYQRLDIQDCMVIFTLLLVVVIVLSK